MLPGGAGVRKTCASAVLAVAMLTLSACASAAHRPVSEAPSPVAGPGARVFATACAYCHTLGTPAPAAKQGGDLAGYRMTLAQVKSFTRVMPMRRPLRAGDLRAVSEYVLAAQQRAQPTLKGATQRP